MTCSASCGSDREMMDSLIEAAINKALADGTLQGKLKDCDGNDLGPGAKVMLCSALTAAVNDAIKDGDVQVVKGIELSDGKLKITDGTGKVTEKTLPGIMGVEVKDGKLVTTGIDGTKEESQLPGFKSVVVKDGKLVVTPINGEKEETVLPGAGELKVEDGKLEYTENGKDKEIQLPFVRDLNFDNSTVTFTWKDGAVEKSEKMPFVQAVKGEKEIVFTLPDGSTVSAPVLGKALDEDSFDDTIEKGANKDGKFGVKLNPKGGLQRTVDGVGLKLGGGVTVNDKGEIELGGVEVEAPLKGKGTKAEPLGINLSGRDFQVNPVTGEVSLKATQNNAATNLNNGVPVIGYSTFFGDVDKARGKYVVGVPVKVASQENSQNATAQLSELADGEQYDFNGWQIASPVQVDQYLVGTDDAVWHRTNDGGMNDDGSLKDASAWSVWRRETNNSVSVVQIEAMQKTIDDHGRRIAALEQMLAGFVPLKDASGTVTLGLIKP